MNPDWFQQLSLPAQTLLLGAGGNFLGGLAGGAVGRLLEAVGARVRKQFKAEPRRRALNLALGRALVETVEGLTDDPNEVVHFLGIFGEWLAREEVIVELSQVIDPRPEAEIDLALLSAEFEAAGYAPEMLGEGREFPAIVARLVRGFYDAAAAEPELRGPIEIGLLKGIAERAEGQLREARRQRRAVERIAEKVAPDLEPRRRNYLERLAGQCGVLPLRGVDLKVSDASAGAAEPLSLADVYVGMDTTTAVDAAKGESGERSALAGREKPRPLSALGAFAGSPRMVLLGDPGGGKSTFVNHLAYCLASQQLEPEAAWLDRLPELPPEWAGLLPVRVVLRDLAAWVGAARPDASMAGLLLAYLAHWARQRALEDYGEALAGEIRAGRALLLLDGLDEVSLEGDILPAVKEMIEDLPRALSGSPILLTCRVLSYEDKRWRLGAEEWPVFELAQLDEAKVDRFIGAWYRQIAGRGVVEDGHAAAGRLSTAVRKRDLWRLARNPLLLTVMALVHTHKGELPDARAVLYEDVVDLLLWRWDAIRLGEAEDRKTEGRGTGMRDLLDQAGLKDIDLKQTIWRLAFDAHSTLVEGAEAEVTADIAEATLHRELRRLHPEKSLDWADRLVQIIKLRAGLLLEGTPGVFSFPHRTFEEYLAGCHLGNLPDFSIRAVELTEAGAFWREVIVLAVGRQVHLSGDVAKPLLLVSELCPEAGPDPDDTAAWRKVWLAGECLREIGPARAERHELGAGLVRRVRERLTELVAADRLEPRERAEAGSVLGVLGDERDLEEMVEVPGGGFLMGSTAEQIEALGEGFWRDWAEKNEAPQHSLSVEAFRIGKYPVTNGLYARFVASGGRAPEHWRGQTPPSELINHPVVRVSWHDALAYCRWLAGERGEEIRLPTEAEWERAARGTEGRTWPWGDQFSAKLCNSAEAGIGNTSPVGIFAGGASPYGCLDMAGNVWEWTLTLRGQGASKPDFGYPYVAEDGREDIEATDGGSRVLRGGSFDFSRGRVRCAYRLGFDPRFRDVDIGFRVVAPGL